MRYSAQQYARALRELAGETATPKRRALIRNFLASLAKNNCLALIPEIVREYEEQKAQERGVRAVVARAPKRMSETGLARKLCFRARIDSRCDARLMGGVIIETGGVRVDNSIAMRLQRLQGALCA